MIFMATACPACPRRHAGGCPASAIQELSALAPFYQPPWATRNAKVPKTDRYEVLTWIFTCSLHLFYLTFLEPSRFKMCWLDQHLIPSRIFSNILVHVNWKTHGDYGWLKFGLSITADLSCPPRWGKKQLCLTKAFTFAGKNRWNCTKKDPWYSAHQVSVCSIDVNDQCRECHHQSSTSMVCRWYQDCTKYIHVWTLSWLGATYFLQIIEPHWFVLRNFVTLHPKLFHDTM